MLTNEKLSAVTPADWVLGPKQGEWTYDDYAALPNDGQHYEIVHGVLVMTPSPDVMHQRISGRIFRYLSTYVEDAGLGLVFTAPLDVELAPENVFQPDVLVLLNRSLNKIRESRIVGAPDLVVEVASPSTEGYDRLNKYDIYAEYGIPEYWMVKSKTRSIEILVLGEGHYRSLGVFIGKQTLPSSIVPNLPVRVEQFFA